MKRSNLLHLLVLCSFIIGCCDRNPSVECLQSCENQRNAVISKYDQCVAAAYDAYDRAVQDCRDRFSGAELAACLDAARNGRNTQLANCMTTRDIELAALSHCEGPCYKAGKPDTTVQQ